MDLIRLKPADPRVSEYNMDVRYLKDRAVSLPDIVSVLVDKLFPELPKSTDYDLNKIRESTKEALNRIDLEIIKPGQSVNVLASSHGFTIFGGKEYVEMLKTIHDELKRRCNPKRISLKAGVGLRMRETQEAIKKFSLDEYFSGGAESISPLGTGIPIETEIGVLYGAKKAYSADWIIHTHNNDIRELHYHRQIGRLLKPFTMSYATIEMRSAYHQSMGPRAANLLPRMVYQSKFVQDKFLCSAILKVAPTGIIGVDIARDLLKQDENFTRFNLESYGKIITLLSYIKDIILIIDYPGPIPYTTAGGILLANFLNANVDEFDLDVAFPPYNRYSTMIYSVPEVVQKKQLVPMNPEVKAIIINYASKGFPSTFYAQEIPTFVVGAQADFLNECEQNTQFMKYAVKADNLRSAYEFAKKISKSEKILIFDGAIGGFNVSASLAEDLMRLSPQVREEVENIRMKKWLGQRGMTVK